MDVAKKVLKIEDAFEYNMKRLYARLLVLSQTRDISLQELFKYDYLLCQRRCLMTTGSPVREIKVSWLTSWQFLLQMTMKILR